MFIQLLKKVYSFRFVLLVLIIFGLIWNIPSSIAQAGGCIGCDDYPDQLNLADRPHPHSAVVYVSDGNLQVTRPWQINITSPITPEIDVKGNNISIIDGDTAPSASDQTDFGSTLISIGSVSHTFTISNTGDADLTLTGTPKVVVSGPNADDFTINPMPDSPVAPGSYTEFSVIFDPSASGLRTATISIANNDSDDNPYTFAIQGTGTAASAPEMDVRWNGISIAAGDSSPSISDGTIFESTAVLFGTVSHSFAIHNTGNADLTLTGTPKVAVSGTNAADFTVNPMPSSPVTLGSYTEFTVTFDPIASGLRTATISIANNDSDENPYTFAIQGTGLTSCYVLALSHTGLGGDPLATPTNSPGCPVGQYVVEETITLTAAPAAGYHVVSWNGTNNNASTAITNTTSMPAGPHTVTANYIINPPPNFQKTSPPDTTSDLLPSSVTLNWENTATATSYEYCYDTSDNSACDGSWVSTGNTNHADLSGLSFSNTYYWQVRAINSGGSTYANMGEWWEFSVTGEPTDHKVYLPLALFDLLPEAPVPGDMTFIPAGEFQMGCDPIHNGGYPCESDELPLHTIYLDAYYMDVFEVTNIQYLECVASGSCTSPGSFSSKSRSSYYSNPDYADYPVIHVSWDQASAYCSWLGKRLPSEAEWEKAARGGSKTLAYPWGDQDTNCTLANSWDNHSSTYCIGDTNRVGSYPDGASEYNVFDMAGNVWEWVNDRYSSTYYRISPYRNPSGPTSGSGRVMRGGSWGSTWINLRASGRNYEGQGYSNEYIGFRCADSP